MSRSAAGFVVVGTDPADTKTLDHDAVLLNADHPDDIDTAEQLLDAVSRLRSRARARGRPLCSVQMTWSDDADPVARHLLTTWAGSPLVVTKVPFSLAVETMAQRIGPADMAVCLLEPESTKVLESAGGRVHSAVSDVPDGQHLAEWVARTLDRKGWRPERVVVVGSRRDSHVVTSQLEAALPISIATPIQAQMALARAAVLTPLQSDKRARTEAAHTSRRTDTKAARTEPIRRPRSMAPAAVVAALAALCLAVIALARIHRPEPVQPAKVTDTPATAPAHHELYPRTPAQESAPSPSTSPATPPTTVSPDRGTPAQSPAPRPGTQAPQAPPPPPALRPPDDIPPPGGPPPVDNCFLLCGVTL